MPIAEATYKSALAAVERAKAALQQAELNLAYTHITAPITGQVTQKSVDLGQYVSPGQLLFTIVPLDQVYVTANFKETQLENVAPVKKSAFTWIPTAKSSKAWSIPSPERPVRGKPCCRRKTPPEISSKSSSAFR